jgi:hypothetical protein
MQIPQDNAYELTLRKQIEELKAQLAIQSRDSEILERGAPIASCDDQQN